MSKQDTAPPPKAPLHWTGVVFALAANLLLPTALESISGLWLTGSRLFVLVSIVAPLIAGATTASYTRQRGGMHAFLGALISVPILGFFVFPGQWQLAIFAGAFCTLGGAVTELYLRQRTTRTPA